MRELKILRGLRLRSDRLMSPIESARASISACSGVTSSVAVLASLAAPADFGPLTAHLARHDYIDAVIWQN